MTVLNILSKFNAMNQNWKAEIESKGYAVIRNAFDIISSDDVCRDIERIHSDFSSLKLEYPELHRLGEWSVRSPHRASKSIRKFLHSEENRDLCRQLVGNSADLYWCTTAAKPPARGRSFPWHQDAGYGEGPKDYLIFWAAFDDVDEDNGCLWAIPESHRDGIMEHEYRKINDFDYAGVFLKNPHPREKEMISLPVKKGDIVCMSSKLVHATFQNNSARPRRALIFALLEPTPESSYLIRGEKEVIDPYLRNGQLQYQTE
jgi:phytanoyl-CoA hydroxylase